MNLLKVMRNLVGDSVARVVVRVPALESAYIRLGRTISRTPCLATLYRRSRDTLVELWKINHQNVRKLRIGAGTTIWFDIAEYGIKEAYFLGHTYEELTTKAFCDFLKPGDIFLDVGANAGYYTILAGRLVGKTGKVLAFEPNPSVRSQLAAHIQVNGLHDVATVIPLALSDEDAALVNFWIPNYPLQSGLGSLNRASVDKWEGQPVGGTIASATRISVQTSRFDTWINAQNLTHIDLMKVDVEGAEDKVFDGMRETLLSRPPRRIICETNPGGKADALLREIGYHVRPLDAGGSNWSNYLYFLS